MSPSEYPHARDYGGTRRSSFPETSEGERLARIIRRHNRGLSLSFRAMHNELLNDLRRTNRDNTDVLRAMVNALPFSIRSTHRVYEVLTKHGHDRPSNLITTDLMQANQVIHTTFRPQQLFQYLYLEELVVLAATSVDPMRVARIVEERRLYEAAQVQAVMQAASSTEPVLYSGVL